MCETDASSQPDGLSRDAIPAARSPFVFLNIGHPLDAQSGKLRRAARSHIAYRQHQRAGGANAGPWPPTGRRRLNSKWTQPDHSHHKTRQPKHPEDSPDEPLIPKQLAISQHDPFNPYHQGADWVAHIPSLVGRYLSRARTLMRGDGLVKEAQSIRSRDLLPILFSDSFAFNAIITLAMTNVRTSSHYYEKIIVCIRKNFLLTISEAIGAEIRHPKKLAVGIALLIGWEAEVGDPSICKVHMKALPGILKAKVSKTIPPSGFSYSDESQGFFRARKTIPEGFVYYASQNLLPPGLLSLVGGLASFDPDADGSKRWLRERWASIGACEPQKEAGEAFRDGQLSAQVGQLVRHAGMMLGSFLRMSANERPVAQPLTSGIVAIGYSTLAIEWYPVVGTVYDEIVLWCLCMFAATSGSMHDEHAIIIRNLLEILDVWTIENLISLFVTRYVFHSCLHQPLLQVWRQVWHSDDETKECKSIDGMELLARRDTPASNGLVSENFSGSVE